MLRNIRFGPIVALKAAAIKPQSIRGVQTPTKGVALRFRQLRRSHNGYFSSTHEVLILVTSRQKGCAHYSRTWKNRIIAKAGSDLQVYFIVGYAAAGTHPGCRGRIVHDFIRRTSNALIVHKLKKSYCKTFAYTTYSRRVRSSLRVLTTVQPHLALVYSPRGYLQRRVFPFRAFQQRYMVATTLDETRRSNYHHCLAMTPMDGQI